MSTDTYSHIQRGGGFPKPPAKALLVAAGYRQAELARRCGLTTTYVSGILNGRLPPSPRVMDALVEVTGVEPSDLFPNDLLYEWRVVRAVRSRGSDAHDDDVVRRVAALIGPSN